MNCKSFMRLKFVKGFSLSKKCNFSGIKMQILLKQKDCSLSQSSLLYSFNHSEKLFHLKHRSAVTEVLKTEFPVIFPHSGNSYSSKR